VPKLGAAFFFFFFFFFLCLLLPIEFSRIKYTGSSVSRENVLAAI